MKWVRQMHGVGCADVLLYFKCPTTKQMRCPVNAYEIIILSQGSQRTRSLLKTVNLSVPLQEIKHKMVP